MRVELITVGDELLLGSTVNTNAAWLGQRLSDSGIEITRSVVVGDDLDHIAEVVRTALRRVDAVITTGGLGPTSDDLTREALAAVAGVRLVRDPVLAERLRERAAALDRPMPAMVLRMAEMPEGATQLANSTGAAPGLRVELSGGGVVYALPGVPYELHAIVDEVLLPELRTQLPGPVPVRRTLRTAGLWESVLAERLAPVEALPDVGVAYLPSPGEVRVRLTAGGLDAPALLGKAEALARELLGGAVYGEEEDTLDQVVHRLLAEHTATVAVAESLTGGLLGVELTRMPGSSATFVGGVIAYATEQKTTLLGVPPELLAAHGAVHPDVARAMAAGVRDRLGATYGLAVTGVAGPSPQDGQPVGTVHVAVAGTGQEPVAESPVLAVPRGRGERARGVIRRMTIVYALDLLRRQILGLGAARYWTSDRGDEHAAS